MKLIKCDSFLQYKEMVSDILQNNRLDYIPVFAFEKSAWLRIAKKNEMELLDYNVIYNQKIKTKNNDFHVMDNFWYENDNSGKEDAVMVIGEDEEYIIPGKLFAYVKKRSFYVLENFDELIDKANSKEFNSITLIFNVSKTDTSMMHKLVNYMETSLNKKGGTDSVMLGCLTGRDSSSLTWLIAKNILDFKDNGRTLLIQPLSGDGDIGEITDDYCVITGENCVGEKIYPVKDIKSLPLKSFVIEEHGRSDHVNFNDGIICGDILSGLGECSRSQGCLPQCAYGLGCFKKDFLLPVVDIRSKFLFIHSCTSAHLSDSIYEKDYLLSLAVIDGMSMGYLGSLRAKINGDWESVLFCHAIRSGMPIGRVTTLLNRIQIVCNGETPCFLLIGDPLNSLYQEFNLINENLITISSEIVTVNINTNNNAFVSIPIEFKDNLKRALYLRILDKDYEDKIYGLIDSECENPRMYLWTKEKCLPQNVKIEILTEKPYDNTLKERWESILENYDANRRYSIIPSSFDSPMDKAKQQAYNLASALRKYRVMPKYYEECLKNARNLEKMIDEYDKRLIKAFLGIKTKPLSISDSTENCFDISGNTLLEKKCWCGRELLQTNLKPTMEIRGKRKMFSCLRCGDVGLCSEDDISLNWLGDEKVEVGGVLHHRLCITNNTNKASSGYVGLLFSKAYGGDIKFVPQIQAFKLMPNETTDLEFDMKMENIAPHMYVVQAYIIHQSQIEYFRKFIQVVIS